jgi:two-component system response regulator YesN
MDGKSGNAAHSPTGPPTFDPGSINKRAFDYYSRLQRIQQHVRDHPEELISLRRAARIACLSEAYFSSFFHEKVGVRFRDWRSHQKVLHAIELLETHNRTITEVAMGVGFGDLRTFERTFKRHTGLTPRQFRRAVRP